MYKIAVLKRDSLRSKYTTVVHTVSSLANVNAMLNLFYGLYYWKKWFNIRSVGKRKEMCPDCKGHGTLSKPPYDDSGICPTCDGKGDI